MDIQEMYNEEKKSFEKKDKENLERKLRLYVNGGFQGLIDIYYNFHQEQNIKFSEIIPFEVFVNTNKLEEFYLDTVFFEIQNKYITNIGHDIKSLCNYYINSDEIIESKITSLISVINRLEEEIYKSSISNEDSYPRLFNVLKKIQTFYSIAYENLYDDFNPFLSNRPKKNQPQNKTVISDVILPFDKLGLKNILMTSYIKDFFESESILQEEGEYIKNNKWIKDKKELIIFCKVIFERGYIKPKLSLKAVFNFFEKRYDIKLGDQTKPSKHKNFKTNEFDFTLFEKKK